jgi:hypothetical protein
MTKLPNGNWEVSVRPPLVYLDHWAVREIAKNPLRRDHFLETFKSRGTLLFSVFNMAEMGQNSGRSYQQICDLLDGVDAFWIFIESDVDIVQQRIVARQPPPATFLGSLDLLGTIVKTLPVGTYKLGSALAALQGEDFRAEMPRLLQRPAMLQLFQGFRADHKRGRKMLPNRLPRETPAWIMLELARHLVKDGKNIENNDVIDLLHAVVPLCFAHIVLLEKAWRSYASKLRLSDTHVFAAPQLDEALEVMRTLDVSKMTVARPNPPLIIDARPPGQES